MTFLCSCLLLIFDFYQIYLSVVAIRYTERP
uniref:Uncharacterized protein n=1 Tax=Siphoviridae sp. ctgaY24 TaxID=2827911 RepID=A0A8S5SAC7_9CAUD|nr:MAG TPA: hypothetical protein [Siphoviridae sp. ctgaY24]DAJ47993.1 MAG TPA: hypothetical protein [Caudoviricetes sp.]